MFSDALSCLRDVSPEKSKIRIEVRSEIPGVSSLFLSPMRSAFGLTMSERVSKPGRFERIVSTFFPSVLTQPSFQDCEQLLDTSMRVERSRPSLPN